MCARGDHPPTEDPPDQPWPRSAARIASQAPRNAGVRSQRPQSTCLTSCVDELPSAATGHTGPKPSSKWTTRRPLCRATGIYPSEMSARCPGCGDPVQRRRGGRADARCRKCAQRAGVYSEAATGLERDFGRASCEGCGNPFTRNSPGHRYCDPCAIGRDQERAAARDRHLTPEAAAARLEQRRTRYGAAHKVARRAYADQLAEAGSLPCVLCGHLVHDGQRWELDHVPGTDDQYRGIAHGQDPCPTCGRRCNAGDGGARGALAQKQAAAARRAGLG